MPVVRRSMRRKASLAEAAQAAVEVARRGSRKNSRPIQVSTGLPM